ncbi:extracellular solute-binding protein [Paenibacillus sp. JTLBN-2024]
MKKWISLVLASALLTVGVAGCGKGSGSEAADASDESKPLKFSISLTTSGNSYAESAKDINNDKWVKEFEKRANIDVDIQMIPLKDFDSKMSIMFAGGEIPDVVQNVGGATDKSMSGSIEAGVFMPLDDLLKEYAPNIMKAVPKEAWAEVSYKGKIYGVPTWLSNPSRRATFIRTDLLEKTGLPVPKTMDDLLNVLRAFKNWACLRRTKPARTLNMRTSASGPTTRSDTSSWRRTAKSFRNSSMPRTWKKRSTSIKRCMKRA